jgi:hypothetical protein
MQQVNYLQGAKIVNSSSDCLLQEWDRNVHSIPFMQKMDPGKNTGNKNEIIFNEKKPLTLCFAITGQKL